MTASVNKTMEISKRLFAIVSDGGYYPGLYALLNSIHTYHGDEIPVHVYVRGMEAKQLDALNAHRVKPRVWPVTELPMSVLGIWEAKQQVFAHCLGRACCVYLLDADLVLTSRVDDVFALADEGKIVSSSDGGAALFGSEYAVYSQKLPGVRAPYINSGALCLDIRRHWDLVALWAFASRYGAYSPGGGMPLCLPGHGDQGVFNAIAAMLGKTEYFHVLPEGTWCDSTQGCTLRILARDDAGRLEVWNETEKAPQRLVHSSGPKWWTADGLKHLQQFGDKHQCFLHFSDKTSKALELPNRIEPAGSANGGTPQILIGICSCHLHSERRKAVRESWLRALPEGARALFFIGTGEPCDEPGLVTLPVSDLYIQLPAKVHCFFRYALAHYEFDYLFKCDDDTYVHPGRLKDLARPDVDLIGSVELKTLGFASGGAGYLMSRRMVEQLVAKPITQGGAEDVIFSSRAKASGLRMEGTRVLQGCAEHQQYRDRLPEAGNDIVTVHRCGPYEMRRIHAAVTGEHPGPVLLTLHARHPAWSGTIRLYADGTFWGGAASPNGTWGMRESGELLILGWHHWPVDVLRLQPSGFEGTKLRLEFINPGGMEQWRRFQDDPAGQYMWRPKVVVRYKGGLGNKLFQFAAGWLLSQKANATLSARAIAGFHGTKGFDSGNAAFEPLHAKEDDLARLNVDAYIQHIRRGSDVVVEGDYQYYEMLRPMKSEIKSLLSSLDVPELDAVPGDDDFVVHVRLGNYFSPALVQRFGYSLEDVLAVIKKERFNRLWVMCNEREHPFIEQLRTAFGAIVGGKDVLADFSVLLKAKRLLITPSTFGWWAAWLGRAESIYFPAGKGIWKKGWGYNLLVDDEPRYIPY